MSQDLSKRSIFWNAAIWWVAHQTLDAMVFAIGASNLAHQTFDAMVFAKGASNLLSLNYSCITMICQNRFIFRVVVIWWATHQISDMVVCVLGPCKFIMSNYSG